MQSKELIDTLIKNYNENKLAHAYLFETNNIDLCYKDVIRLIKAINCPEKYNEMCSNCNICHLIDEETLPSFIVIKPEDNTIKKDSIDYLKKSFSMAPTYTNNNIYVIISPEKMNNYSFNKMLTFLEEPEPNIIGFYITETSDKISSTILSRLEKIIINYNQKNTNFNLPLDKELYEKVSTLVTKLIELLNNKNLLSKEFIFLSKKTILSKTELILFINLIYTYLITNYNNTKDHDSKIKWINLTKICTDYLEKTNFNGNINLLIDSFIIEIGEVYEK